MADAALSAVRPVTAMDAPVPGAGAVRRKTLRPLWFAEDDVRFIKVQFFAGSSPGQSPT